MPGDLVKGQRQNWLEGRYAVTRKLHVMKMHEGFGTSRVVETYWLSLHERNPMWEDFPLEVVSVFNSENLHVGCAVFSLHEVIMPS